MNKEELNDLLTDYDLKNADLMANFLQNPITKYTDELINNRRALIEILYKEITSYKFIAN